MDLISSSPPYNRRNMDQKKGGGGMCCFDEGFLKLSLKIYDFMIQMQRIRGRWCVRINRISNFRTFRKWLRPLSSK